MWWIVAVVAVVVAVATYLTWLAARVDRLHQRAAAADAALDAQLVRRAAAAAALAALAEPADGIGAVDPTRLAGLAAAARVALRAQSPDRELAENDLTRALRELRPTGGDAGAGGNGVVGSGARSALGAWGEVVTASRRLALARQVHTDLVRDARAMRRRRLVRLLGLPGRHAEPTYFDIDDPIMDGAATDAPRG